MEMDLANKNENHYEPKNKLKDIWHDLHRAGVAIKLLGNWKLVFLCIIQ